MKKFWKHPWTIATCNFLMAMVLFSILRLCFYWINHDLFPEITVSHLFELCAGGLRFDLTALLYLNALYLALMLLPLPWNWRTHHRFQKTTLWIFWIPTLLGIICNGIDMVYCRFTDRRTSMTFFDEFQNDGNLLNIFFTSVVQYWYVTLVCAVIIALLFLLSRRGIPSDTPRPWRKALWHYYVIETVILLVSVYFVVIGIRGGFGAYTRPITMSNALQYTNTPRETLLVLNTPFCLMRSTDSQTYHKPDYFTEEELVSIMNPIHEGHTNLDTHAMQTNVVVLILESFSKENFGFFHSSADGEPYAGYTPFLDSLLQHSITYRYSFASGRKSIDAMPSVLASVPMLIEPYIVTPYSTNDISSLAACLKPKGYTTAFFHGAPNGSMGFQAFARCAGFDAYYGMDEYQQSAFPAAFDGTWAIWDEEFLQYFALTMSTMPQPFCTSVFTASSHHPFRVPERYEGVFPQGTQPLHRCIGYSDNALRKFFDTARQQPWFENTLFVITADHTNQLSFPASQTDWGVFEVPIAFYQYGWQDNWLDTVQVISQTDIMPSVLAYLGYNEPYFAFGENALTQHKTHPWAICYNHPVYQIISDSLLLEFDGQQLTAIYRYQQDPLLQHNCLNELQHTEEVQSMLTYLKAYIQQYINRMIDNRLTTE